MTPAETLILAELASLKAMVGVLMAGNPGAGATAPHGGNGAASTTGRVATAADMASEHGNPKVHKTPPAKYWTGQSYAGMLYSQVQDPAYLDALAKYLDACVYVATKEKQTETDTEKLKWIDKTIRFKPVDAALARGYAQRLRARGIAAPPTPKPAADYGGFGASDNDFGGGYSDNAGGGPPDDLPF